MTKKLKDLITLAKFSNKASQVYPQVVEELIAERYTLSMELSIQRQRDTKPSEFQAYNAYCEECKATAKQLLDL